MFHRHGRRIDDLDGHGRWRWFRVWLRRRGRRLRLLLGLGRARDGRGDGLRSCRSSAREFTASQATVCGVTAARREQYEDEYRDQQG